MCDMFEATEISFADSCSSNIDSAQNFSSIVISYMNKTNFNLFIGIIPKKMCSQLKLNVATNKEIEFRNFEK